MPARLKLSRKRDYTLPAGAVNVARPTKWGNPYRVAPLSGDVTYSSALDAVERYREDILCGRATITVAEIKSELAGKDLACWCDAQLPCHADVLLEIANAP